MTKQEAQAALHLIRNQLDKLPTAWANDKNTNELQNAYTIVYEMYQALEEGN